MSRVSSSMRSTWKTMGTSKLSPARLRRTATAAVDESLTRPGNNVSHQESAAVSMLGS